MRKTNQLSSSLQVQLALLYKTKIDKTDDGMKSLAMSIPGVRTATGPGCLP
jgi:hypothetical protein